VGKSICKRSCVLLMFCIRQLSVAQTPADANLTLNERAFTASKIYSLVQVYFSGWKSLPELDLDIAYRNYLEKALATEGRREFDLATMEFLARLRNGHTVLWDAWLTKNYGEPIEFYARPLDGKWVVQRSVISSVKAGDVLSKIDDTEVESFFRQQQKYIAGSNEAAQRHNLFYLTYLFPAQFTVTLGDGRKVRIDRAGTMLADQTDKLPEGRWLAENATAYIRISSFANSLFEEKALAYVMQFKNAKTLILDVRNNAGGVIPRRLSKSLMDRTYHSWKESTPIHISLLEYYDQMHKGQQLKDLPDFERGYTSAFADLFGGSQLSWGGDLVPPEGPVFHGKLIFLVDGGCASACEDLVGPFKDNRRATLIGETTEGSSGPAYLYDFKNGMTVGIAVKRQYFPDGSEFEGVGIQPDIEIHSSVDDLRAGRDRALDKALELAALP
jgi:carboxyl-terminal processing protease